MLQDPYEQSLLTRIRSIVNGRTADWIRSRKNAGLNNLNKVADIDLAKELFEVWDTRGVGEIDYTQVQEQFIALGLAEKPDQVSKLLR